MLRMKLKSVPGVAPVAMSLALLVSCGAEPGSNVDAAISYPESKRVEVVDTLHGVPIADPYRWLEDTDDPAVQEWTDKQNALTKETLAAKPIHAELVAELTKLWNYSRMGVPVKRGDYYFYEYYDGLQNQAVLYMQKGLEGERIELIDPNELSREGIVAMDWWYPSRDGSKIAYGLSEKGSENSTLHIFDVASRRPLPYSIEYCRYSSVAWLKDNDGFFYTRGPKPGSVPAGEESYHKKVFLHHLASNPDDDQLIFEYAEDPTAPVAVTLAEDLRTLFFYVYYGSAGGFKLYYSRVDAPAEVTLIADREGCDYYPYTTDTKLFIHTNEDAPFYKLLVTDLSHPERANWKVAVPETSDLLENLTIAGNRLVLNYLHNASSKLQVHNFSGEKVADMALPAMGAVTGLSSNWDEPEVMFSYMSFVTPAEVEHYDLTNMKLTTVHKPEVDFDASQYEVKQEWYKSKDGTSVPIFIVHQKGLQMDGTNPALLYGYGGFQVNQTPYYSSSRLMFLKRGGVFAMPNLRGGSEFGEEWHRAGMLEKKQNTFDDFIAAAEYLIEAGYTSKERLAIWGGSNGGLLVGAVEVQRPDLFKAVICTVPLLDMLRFHMFLIARYWTSEYGSAENPEQFKFMYEYSPYQNVKPNVAYPATFLTAGEEDGRVHPLHARKFAALLQHENVGDNPILVWIDRKGGHGQGKPISLRIQETADVYTFLFWQLGMSE